MSDDRKYPASLNGLLKFCTEYTKLEDTAIESRFEPMSEEKKQWLREAFEAVSENDPVKRMMEKINVVLKPDCEIPTDDKVNALEEIASYCEDIDLANDFYKIGGFEILSFLLNDNHSKLRSATAELIAILSQNNPYCQNKLLDTNEIFPLLIKKLSDENEASDVKIKCLYATSCISRESIRAHDILLNLDGFKILLQLLHSDVEKLRSKSSFLIGSLCAESHKIKDLIYNLGAIKEFVNQLHQEPHTPSHELITQALLNMVKDYPPAQVECSKSEYKLKELIMKRVDQLADDETYQDEVQKLEQLMKICFPMKQ